jgi:hypothetical protein
VSLFQNPVGAKLRFDAPRSWRNRPKPGFPTEIKEAVPKAEALEQPQVIGIK